MIFLDTHAAIFLHAGELDAFSDSAKIAMEAEDIAISPMAALEMDYLMEIGRIRYPSALIIDDLTHDIGLIIPQASWLEIIRIASGLTWTRDPFDRIITAHAMLRSSRLITRDRRIQEAYPHAFF